MYQFCVGFCGQGVWEEALHDMCAESIREPYSAVLDRIYNWKLFSNTAEPENSDKVIKEIREQWVKVLGYLQAISEERGVKFIVGDEVILRCYSRLRKPVVHCV